MKVTVTGAGGYIGSVLVPMLLEAGHEVTALDRFFFGETLAAASESSSRCAATTAASPPWPTSRAPTR